MKYQECSLNDNLYHGPDLANNLLGILLRFGEGQVANMEDIEKMFYQVLLIPKSEKFY